MSWFAIALDEIRTRRILREKANCKQSKICLVHRFLNEGLVACVQTHPPTSISLGEGTSVHGLKLGGSRSLKNRGRLRNRRRSFR